MPIPISQAKKGETVQMPTKKIDKAKLIEMLKKNAYTADELAKAFGAKVSTIKMRLYKLKKDGVKIQARKVDGKTYYFIEG